MKLKFVRNIHFTRLIKIDGRLKEFNFRKANHHTKGHFSVDTIDQYGERIIFKMEKSAKGWFIITPNLPDWIMEQEPRFNELIGEELKVPEEPQEVRDGS